jgi:hypothetical protein
MAKQDNYTSALFVSSDSNCQHNALIYNGELRDFLVIMGYREAADILVERVLLTERGQNTLIYPIGFLYRHYLELLLKNIIVNGREVIENKQISTKGHKLDILWTKAKFIIHEIYEEPYFSDEEEMDKIIEDFMEADATSQAFRYRKDVKDKNCLENIDMIDIKKFAESIKKIGDFLDNVSAGIAEQLDYIKNGC